MGCLRSCEVNLKPKGFTLVELMIVIAIIGILAAIALPAYSSYVGRAQAVEAFQLANALQATVEMWYDENGSFPGPVEVANTGVVGSEASSLQGKYISDNLISIAANTGVITIPFDNGSNAGTNLILTPVVSGTDIVSWSCGGTIKTTNLPATC